MKPDEVPHTSLGGSPERSEDECADASRAPVPVAAGRSRTAAASDRGRANAASAVGRKASCCDTRGLVYVGRQPIVNRHGALRAYELLFRDHHGNRAVVRDDAQATAQVVARTLGELGVAAVLGAYPGYVNISGELLLDDIVHIMPPDRFVLEILETVSFDAALAKRCEQLRRNGFRLALDDVAAISVNLLAALPYVDVVKIDLVQAKHDDLPALVELVKSGRKRLVAEKVETHADFQLALDLGCDLFQGYFFARPQVLTSRHTGSSRLALMRLLAVLASDPDIGELETQLKLNPKLVMQLLRLVNSSAVGLSQKISSVRAAIIAIGTRQIARWAQLLLFADGRTLPLHADPLVQLAGTRAHCMEMMAHRLRPEEEFFGAAAFMAGLFSLIDVVFGEPLEHILDQLTLAPEIRGAIVAREGLLGKLLNLCEASERGDIATLDTEDPELAALSPTVLAELGIAAAAWFDRQIGQY